MKYEVFENILMNIIKTNETDRKFYDLGLDMTNVVDEYNKIISTLLSAHYSDEGSEWIDWFLYERESMSGEILTATDKDGNNICYDMKSLWEYVEKIRLSKDFVEYELKIPMSDEEKMKMLEQLFTK